MKKKTKTDRIYDAIIDILAKYPHGIASKELAEEIHKKLAEKIELSSTTSWIAKLAKQRGGFVKKTIKGREKNRSVFYFPPGVNKPNFRKRVEGDYYKSFIEYLTYDKNKNKGNPHLNECTKAVVVGGNKFFKNGWFTPDVMGVSIPSSGSKGKFSHEIISVEIKVNPDELIKALGQVCAYRLFSHKVYLVIPKNSQKSDHLETLCRILGIGLVYFNPNAGKITSSIYELKVSAQRHTSDMNSMNSIVLKDVRDELYDKTKPNKTKSNKTKPNKTKPNKTKPNKTKPNKTKPSRR